MKASSAGSRCRPVASLCLGRPEEPRGALPSPCGRKPGADLDHALAARFEPVSSAIAIARQHRAPVARPRPIETIARLSRATAMLSRSPSSRASARRLNRALCRQELSLQHDGSCASELSAAAISRCRPSPAPSPAPPLGTRALRLASPRARVSPSGCSTIAIRDRSPSSRAIARLSSRCCSASLVRPIASANWPASAERAAARESRACAPGRASASMRRAHPSASRPRLNQ